MTDSYHKLFGSDGYHKVIDSCNNHKQCGYCLWSRITSDNWLVPNILFVLLLPNTNFKILFDNFELSSQCQTVVYHKLTIRSGPIQFKFFIEGYTNYYALQKIIHEDKVRTNLLSQTNLLFFLLTIK